ncbi:MAG TPA: cytochrome c oxidase assembly protein, partial [Methylophilaceae bacterium]|nr:cytochrome c oxidase assembly protein [Methylophilaceae bacterium]
MHRLTPAWFLIWLIILCGAPLPALAHVVEESASQHQQWWLWTFEPWVVLCLGLSLGLYAIGALPLGNRSHNRRAIIRQAFYFMLGWLVLVIALVSPLDVLGGALFSAHMVQHELLMIVAAPLLVLSRPLVVWLWALPLHWRSAIAGAVRHPLVRAPWRLLSLPLAAWLIHALALWLWHVPAFFDAALANNAIHSLQHLSFLITALFFWWAVLDEQASAAGSGAA